MMTQKHSILLRTLFEMAAEDEPAHLVLLGARMGMTCSRTAQALAELERAGLVDADRVRLTMAGLAWAAIAPRRDRVDRALSREVA